jgi:hypothetical protein
MKMRKIIAVGCCGIVLGGIGSVFMAAPSTAAFSSRCDRVLDDQEAQAAKDLKKHRITQERYDELMAQFAQHRLLFGC